MSTELSGEGAILARAQDIVEGVNAFMEATSDKAIDDDMKAFREAADAEMRVKGHRFKDADQRLDEVELARREERDSATQKVAATLNKTIADIEAALERETEAAKRLQPPKMATPADAMLARIAHGFERQELRAVMSRLTHAELLALYQRTPDTDSPGIVSFIEEELASNFPTISFAAARDSETAARTIDEFNTAVRERREKRIPKFVQEVRARLAAYVPVERRILLKQMMKATPAKARFTPTRR